MTPDDRMESRGEKGWSARDNVLFELGMFLGKLGRERTFIFVQETGEKGKDVKIPADLAGITIPRFSFHDDHDLIASVNAATTEMRGRIRTLGRRHGRMKLAESWGFVGKGPSAYMRLGVLPLHQNKKSLSGKKLVLLARRHNPDISLEDDTAVVIGDPRRPSDLVAGDLVLRVSCRALGRRIKAGEVLETHLVLVPDSLDVKRCKTILQLIDQGGELLESKGKTWPRIA